MTKTDKVKLLDEITSHYLSSRDFNGILSTNLLRRFRVDFNEFCDVLTELILERKAGILYEQPFTNPSIIQICFESEAKQIERLSNLEAQPFCIYPLPAHLDVTVDRTKYSDKPYNLALALGSPQLAFRSFDPSVLEYYQNDPRYMFNCDEIKGQICYDTENMAERDKILLERFGFSYNSDLNRAVAVVLRYLARLSPEHQQVWSAREISGDYKIHPDYYQNNILGEFREHESIFTAFIDEVHLICKMTKAMNRPALFHKDFEDKPEGFRFLIRPTLKEFNEFVHLLDKTISENINKAFFQNEVLYETAIKRKDGNIQIQHKGTLQILDDWMKKSFRTNDWESWNEAMDTFREIRKMRQKPGHDINKNVYDHKYIIEQRNLMMRAYGGIRILRMILENHPSVKNSDIVIPEYLREGKIRTL